MGLNIAQCYLATRPLIIPCRIDTLTGANDLTQETGIGKKISLCSKRFKSSYGAKARAEAKKKKGCSLPNFLDELARQRLPSRQEKDQGNAVTEIF